MNQVVETIASAAVTGLDVRRVQVEVSIARGTPLIQIVGLAESAVREGRERIRAAAGQLGLHVPGLRITVNLAPAALRKHGAAFDLPITVGILAAAGSVTGSRVRRYAVAGELGLDGRLRSIRGALPIALHFARADDIQGLIIPYGNLRETQPVVGLDVRGAKDLASALRFLKGESDLPRVTDLPSLPSRRSGTAAVDLCSIYGQERAKRALEVAAAGGHNLLMYGAPGAGKTTLARALPGLLPPMTPEEAVEVTGVHSVAGRLGDDTGLVDERPFRAPHHSVSQVGLIGGGVPPRPGEVSLAHRGVLFLDELPEFGRRSLEALRQPLEEGVTHIVRARYSAVFPARFTLVAAMNPCPCGYLTADDEGCSCDPVRVDRYLSRLSGPLLDRIDMHLQVPSVCWAEMRSARRSEASARGRRRVCDARARAAERSVLCNAELSRRVLMDHCRPNAAAEALLGAAVERFRISVRGYHRILKVARTIADLSGSDGLGPDHVAEAIQYRTLHGATARARS